MPGMISAHMFRGVLTLGLVLGLGLGVYALVLAQRPDSEDAQGNTSDVETSVLETTEASTQEPTSELTGDTATKSAFSFEASSKPPSKLLSKRPSGDRQAQLTPPTLSPPNAGPEDGLDAEADVTKQRAQFEKQKAELVAKIKKLYAPRDNRQTLQLGSRLQHDVSTRTGAQGETWDVSVPGGTTARLTPMRFSAASLAVVTPEGEVKQTCATSATEAAAFINLNLPAPQPSVPPSRLQPPAVAPDRGEASPRNTAE